MKQIALTSLAIAWAGVAQAGALVPVQDQKPEAGALVLQVLPESSALKAGLKAGDLVTALGSTAVTNCNELVSTVTSSPSTTTLTYRRAGTTQETPVTFNVTADGRPRLGVRCPPPGWPMNIAFIQGSTLALGVETTPEMTLVHVLAINGTNAALPVSPEMITMADGNNNMLKKIDAPTAIAMLSQRNSAPAPAAPPPVDSGTNPLAKSVLNFALSRVGMDQMTAGLASGLAESALSKKSAPSIAVPVPSPAAPKVEALVSTELEPKFAADGAVFFEATPAPVTIMINFGGQKTTMRFDTASK